ncbi:MAG: carbohydrate binding domain-containing protein [Dysgonamonadaceae bacterium]|jgi:hypothetical protein|nr:carbohydrate binding domain-containing protein [Dysgonamonadaceae bacterium]
MKKINYLLGILMLVFATTALGQGTTHIYIAFGQSNMQGPGAIRPQDKTGIPDRLQILNVVAGQYDGQTRNKGQWYKAVPPLIISGSLQHYSGNCTIGLSPADYFGRTVVAQTPENVKVGIIAVANGDLALAAYRKTKGADYFAPGQGGTGRESGRPSDTERQGWTRYTGAGYASLYDAIITNVKLAQSQGGEVKGIILHQGESGRGLTDLTWGNMLKEIYNDMLADLGLEANSIPILCGQTYNGGSGLTNGALANNAAIQAFIPKAYIVSSSGCAARLCPNSDNTHFGSEGLELLGTRYGEEMLKHVDLTPAIGFSLATSVLPAGSGSVNANPAPPVGQGYDEGTVVTLTAEPANGWAFSEWSGDITGTQNPVTVTMNTHKNVTANFLPTQPSDNLIKNGTFVDVTNWQYNVGSSYGGGQGVFSVSNNQATLTVTAQGANVYSPQLVQHGIPLVNGYKYRFEIDAWAASNRTFNVVFQMGSNPWTSYSEKTFNLTTSEQHFVYEFEMTHPSDPGIQLSFNTGLGQQGNNAAPTVYLKNASLIYLGITGIDEISKRTSNLFVNVLPNSALNVNFMATGSETDLRLYSLNGNLIASAKLQTVAGKNYSHSFDQGKLPNGFYAVRAQSSGSVEQAKVVIAK